MHAIDLRDHGMARGHVRRTLEPVRMRAEARSDADRMIAAIGDASLRNRKSLHRVYARIKASFGDRLVGGSVARLGSKETRMGFTAWLPLDHGAIEVGQFMIDVKPVGAVVTYSELARVSGHAVVRLVQRGNGIVTRKDIGRFVYAAAVVMTALCDMDPRIEKMEQAMLPPMFGVVVVANPKTRDIITVIDATKMGDRRQAWFDAIKKADDAGDLDAVAQLVIQSERILKETRAAAGEG